ncbi:surface-adhesin E family protein [Moraxella catarrhalis]|uniref:Surface-adhesin protein E-like domain-containing protein n=1 Tax=Moraxella catarrhalis TaxID=480 RepID=A0A198UMJ7_MORCA|nr:surface-adhesin E family protein [Moraxella catarrhalis]OAU96182.1 hypothetical protein AO383_1634 [Moraxella catarrhalis]OAU97713.1 hypothetical protein AO384_0399 [Moraxella catarrhalis]OAV02542.1 hypothetical protein AO385_0944 [Moraxella catarrhalis]
MTRLYPIALMLMTALTALPAQAADWRYILTDSDNMTIHVDYDSLKRHSFTSGGRYYTAWTKWTYPSAQKTYDGKLYRETKDFQYFDCSNQKWDFDAVYYYTSTGQQVDSATQTVSTTSSATWQRMIPDSIGAATLDSVCSLARQKFGSI